MPCSPNLSETGYRDFFDCRRGFVKSLTKTALKSSMPVTPRNRSPFARKTFSDCRVAERYKVLFFFRVTFERRNARGILSSCCPLCHVRGSLLYSRYVADSGNYVKCYNSNLAKRLLLAYGDMSSLARIVTLRKCTFYRLLIGD